MALGAPLTDDEAERLLCLVLNSGLIASPLTKASRDDRRGSGAPCSSGGGGKSAVLAAARPSHLVIVGILQVRGEVCLPSLKVEFSELKIPRL